MEFIIRPFTKEDIISFALSANNKHIADNLRNVFPYPYTVEDATWYIETMIAKGDDGQLVRAIDVDGKAVGSIGVFKQTDVCERSAELGYWLNEEYWGKGIMTEAVKRLTKEAFGTLDIERIFVEPFAYNTGSRRVLEKAGYTYEGTMKKGIYKRGEFFDYCMYRMLREEVK